MKKLFTLITVLFIFILTGTVLSQNVEVSTGGPVTNYATLKLAFDAINAGTHTGTILIEIASNTTETAPAVLNSSGAGSASYTSITIRPRVDGVTISSNFSTSGRGVIELNGADNVTIDGDNPNSIGTNRNLTITNGATNTTTYTSVIRIANSAAVTSSNSITIKNLNINGSATGRNIAAATSTTGSENTTFGIYCGGNGGATVTTAPTAITSVTTNTAPSGTTINSLTVDNNAVLSCARGIVFNGAAASVSTGVTIMNNLVGDQSSLTGDPPYTTPSTSVYTKGIYVQGTNAITINGNSVKNILSYVATLMTGIELNSAIGTGTITISNNTVTGVVSNSSSSTSSLDGIVVSSATGTTYTISNNTVSNVQLISTSFTPKPRGIEVSTTSSAGIIESNRIFNIYNRSTGTGGVYGLNLISGNNITVRNNFIYGINENMTGGAAFSTTFGVFGIRVAAGTGHKIYYNSVNMSDALLGTTATSLLTSCITITATSLTGIDVRNNIFSNTMTGGSTSIAHVSINLPSSGTSAMNLTLNNNAYFNGTDASRQGLAQVGTTAGTGFYLSSNFVPSAVTPSTNFRAYTSTLSAAGTNDNASFASTSAAPFLSNTNLHIDPSISTQIESGGTPISGITTDIDGDTRNATTPDIGADEGTFTPLANMTYVSSTTTQNNTGGVGAGNTNVEILGIQIVTTGSTSPLNLTDLTLETNGSTNAAGDIVNAKVWYTGTSSTFSAINQFGSTFVGPNGSYVVSGSRQLAEGTNYFWVTYDITGGATPNNFIDAECRDLTGSGSMGTQTPTVQAPAGNRQILGPLSGIYTIGLALFNNMTGKNLEQVKLSRTVKKLVPVGIYETTKKQQASEYAISHSIPEKSIKYEEREVTEEYYELHENGVKYTGEMYAKNHGSFGRGVGDYASITAALSDLNSRGVSGAVEFQLLDASYNSETLPLQFNNSIAGVSSTNTITLRPAAGVTTSISGSLSSNAMIKVLSNYVTIDGSNSGGTDRSLSITNNSTTAPSVVLFGSTGTTPITNVTLKNCIITNGINTNTAVVVSDGTTLGNAGYFNTVTIQNNLIQKAFIGVYCIGGTTPQNGFNLNLNNNTLSSTGANALTGIGLYVQGVDGATISQNDIGNMSNTLGSDGYRTGVWLATGCINTTIERNIIHDLNYTGTSGYGANGLRISNGGTTSTGIVMKNNMIYNITGDGDSYSSYGGTYSPIGIYCFATAQTGISIYNNSINLYGNTINFSGAYSIGVCLDDGSVADLRNNIISNTLGRLSVTGNGALCLALETANTQLTNSDYNCYYVNPSSGTKGYVKIGNAGTDQLTMAALRTTTGKDASSFSVLPGFTSNSNLHIPSTTLTVNGRGTYLSGVNNDYDNDSRPTSQSTSVSPVDVGCDQYNAPAGTTGNLTTFTAPFYYDGNLRAVEVVSGTFTVSEIRQFPGLQPPNISLRPGKNNEPKNKIQNNDNRQNNNLEKNSNLKKRDGNSGGQMSTSAVNSPWIYWTLNDFNPSGAVTLRFYYNEEQLSTITEANLKISYWDGSTWDNTFTQSIDASQNFIEVTTPAFLTGPINMLFALEDLNSPLPVVLSDFNITAANRDANLKWTTSSEINNKGFAVERRLRMNGSEDNFSAWKEVTFIQGNGTTNEPKTYTFSDKKLNSGVYQYRLKQVDFNGHSEYYSPAQTDVAIGKPGNFELGQNYPNPSNPKSKIDFQMPFDGKITIKVYDILGQEVKTLIDEFKTADYYTVEFDGSSLASGTYFYRVNAEGQGQKFTKTLKMILVK